MYMHVCIHLNNILVWKCVRMCLCVCVYSNVFHIYVYACRDISRLMDRYICGNVCIHKSCTYTCTMCERIEKSKKKLVGLSRHRSSKLLIYWAGDLLIHWAIDLLSFSLCSHWSPCSHHSHCSRYSPGTGHWAPAHRAPGHRAPGHPGTGHPAPSTQHPSIEHPAPRQLKVLGGRPHLIPIDIRKDP